MDYCIYCMAELSDRAAKFCPVCGKSLAYDCPSHHLMPGTLLSRKYLVGVAIGEGGFGITYIGRDLNLEMKVAIKEYYPNGYANRNNTASPGVTEPKTADRREYFDRGRRRFLREARALAKFSGEPGIVDVRDFFEENNTAYIVMEYLEGQTLKEYLLKNGVIPGDTVIQMLVPVMRSLQKVHKEGIVHRDISPDNIMLVGNQVKLLDFGAARSISSEDQKSLSVLLKPGYAPEEQYRSRGNQGPWSDVYALCATIYKCITGNTPDDSTERLVNDSLKKPSELGVEISPKVEMAIMKGLAVFAENRYQNIEELMVALFESDEKTQVLSNAAAGVVDDDNKTYWGPASGVGSRRGGSTRTGSSHSSGKPGPVMDPPDNTGTGDKAAEEKKERKNKKKTIRIIAICCAVLIVAAVGGILLYGTLDTDSSKGSSDEEATETDAPHLSLDEEDLDFTVFGHTYSYPFTLKEFTDNGWVPNEDSLSTKLEPDKASWLYLSQEGVSLMISFINDTQEARMMTECTIRSFFLTGFENSDFKTHQGFSGEIDRAQIEDLYGTPHFLQENDYGLWLHYTGDGIRYDDRDEYGWYSLKDGFRGEIVFANVELGNQITYYLPEYFPE